MVEGHASGDEPYFCCIVYVAAAGHCKLVLLCIGTSLSIELCVILCVHRLYAVYGKGT